MNLMDMFLIISDCDISCYFAWSCAAKQLNSASSAVKDDCQSTRQIKKPVYRLAETKATDQKSVNKDEDCREMKSFSVQIHGGNCSSKAKHDISGKGKTVCGRKTVEKKLSKDLRTTGTMLRRTEKTSKVSLNEESSQRSPSKLKKQLMSPSLVSAEHKEQRYNVPKKKCRAEEPRRTEHYSNSVKTREPSKASSISKDSSRQKKKMCQKHQEEDCRAKKRLWSDTKTLSTTKQSFTVGKHTTSESSSKVLKNVASVSGSVTSVSHKAAQSSPQHCLTPPLPQNFKIKTVLPRPVDSNNKDVISKNTNLKHETKPSDSEVSIKNSTQENAQQPHRCLDITQGFTVEGQDKRSSLSGQLPAVSSTATEPWCDQVTKALLIQSENVSVCLSFIAFT